MKSEVIEAIRMLAKEKEISEESLFGTIEEALKAAYKKNLPKGENAPNNLDVTVNRENGAISVYARKLILEDEEIEDPTNQISLKDAQKINPTYQMGDIAEVNVTPNGFLRVAAQTAKQVIIQHIREAERGKIYDEYVEKESEILTGIVERIEPKVVYVDLGATGLPAGVSYTVTEAAVSPFTTTKTGDQGTISETLSGLTACSASLTTSK